MIQVIYHPQPEFTPPQCTGQGVDGSPCYGVAGHCSYHAHDEAQTLIADAMRLIAIHAFSEANEVAQKAEQMSSVDRNHLVAIYRHVDTARYGTDHSTGICLCPANRYRPGVCKHLRRSRLPDRCQACGAILGLSLECPRCGHGH